MFIYDVDGGDYNDVGFSVSVASSLCTGTCALNIKQPPAVIKTIFIKVLDLNNRPNDRVHTAATAFPQSAEFNKGGLRSAPSVFVHCSEAFFICFQQTFRVTAAALQGRS